MVWPVFKTATEAPPVAPVGSIPTRSRHSRARPFRRRSQPGRVPAARPDACLLPPRRGSRATPAPGPGLHSRGSHRARRRTRQRDSAVIRPISPVVPCGARSSCRAGGRPGSNRKLTGGIFIAWEGVTLGMTLKTRHELEYLRRTDSSGPTRSARSTRTGSCFWRSITCSPRSRRTCGAHLADFPGDLHLRAVPGGVGASVSLPSTP